MCWKCSRRAVRTVDDEDFGDWTIRRVSGGVGDIASWRLGR